MQKVKQLELPKLPKKETLKRKLIDLTPSAISKLEREVKQLKKYPNAPANVKNLVESIVYVHLGIKKGYK